MATYNGTRFLARQLDTILEQLSGNDELIVSDDGSQDRTVELVESYADPRVRLYRNAFRSASRNFAFALSCARNPAVFLSDQDDEWLPGKVDRLCNCLAVADLVVSDCEVIDDHGSTIHGSYFALAHSGPGILKNIARNTYLGCCIALRKELLRFALPVPRGVSHDLWLGLVAEAFGTTRFVPESLSRFRRHEGSTSSAAGRSRRSLTEKLSERARAALWLARRRFATVAR
jgi:glycosyltransferase involved in cell wall biosynthesis